MSLMAHEGAHEASSPHAIVPHWAAAEVKAPSIFQMRRIEIQVHGT